MNSYEQRQQEKRDRMLERAERIRGESSRLYASGRTALEAIPFGQPILVGHHSERSDRAYRGRAVRKIDKAIELEQSANQLEDRADRVGSGGVSSDDPEAVQKLAKQLAAAEALQAEFKKINAAHVAFLRDPESLFTSDLSERIKEQIRTFVPPYSHVKHPIAAFQITNNGANIRRLRQRIADLEKAAVEPAVEAVSGNGYRMYEDKDENRIVFAFDEKPSPEILALLRSRAFLYSPTRRAHVRKITGNARFAAQQIISKL